MYSGDTLTLARGEDGIATLAFDRRDGSVNIFDTRAVHELSRALDVLEAERSLRGLLVVSNKTDFVVGADINEMPALFEQSRETLCSDLARNGRNFRRLERLAFPVVVAINGFALGGGLEFCLACDVRVASRTASLGLPETGLGILPGWGGTARLPRIAGAATAVDWIGSARQQGADAALQAKVVDLVVEPDTLRAVAARRLEDCVRGTIDWRRLRAAKEQAAEAILAEAAAHGDGWRSQVAQKSGSRYPAQELALASILQGLGKSLDEALAIEARCFADAAQTVQARALVGNFISGQYLMKRAADRARQASRPCARAAVLGAGIMGGGIAYQSALTGTPTLMKDIAQAGLDLGMKEADKLLSKRVKNGQLTPEKRAGILGSIEPTLEYTEGFKSVDVLVEAVVENLRVKHAVLAEAERHVGPTAILCSNTSTLPISDLAQALARPQQFCGMHFFNPVHAMPLVEIIRGRQTSDDTINRAVAYALALKKKPVVVNDCAGFLVNRLLFAYFAGFLRLLHDGADYQHVDAVMERWGWPMGPAYLADVVGLDTMQHCDDVLSAAYATRLRKDFKSWYQLILDLGGLGQKNGRGFYLHSVANGRPTKALNAEAKAGIAALARPARSFTDDEIVERIMVAMGIELAHALEENIVASPQEADVALLYGVGFPAFRGGLARWMDTVGAEAFCAMADEYVGELGALYRVTGRQRDMARRAGRFYSR